MSPENKKVHSARTVVYLIRYLLIAFQHTLDVRYFVVNDYLQLCGQAYPSLMRRFLCWFVQPVSLEYFFRQVTIDMRADQIFVGVLNLFVLFITVFGTLHG